MIPIESKQFLLGLQMGLLHGLCLVRKHGDRFVTWRPDGPANLDFLDLPAFFGPFIFTHSNMGLPSG